MSEDQLLLEIKKNPELFSKVYDEHYRTIFNYCYKRTNDFDAAKDITAESFLKAYLSISKFKWRGISILSWLYRIATNEVNLHYRSKKYRPSILSESGISDALKGKEQALQQEKLNARAEMERHRQFLHIQKVVATLPLKYQTVISLKYFEQMKIREISSVLNKPEGTIKSLLSRGISMLKEKLDATNFKPMY